MQLDVSRVEAEDQEVLQRNTALNKQQAALQTEVGDTSAIGLCATCVSWAVCERLRAEGHGAVDA